MKDIYLLRHSFNNDDGSLDERGTMRALDIARLLPPFAAVITSEAPEAVATAEYLASIAGETDERAGVYQEYLNHKSAISRLAKRRNYSFFDAIEAYEADIMPGLLAHAHGLCDLAEETFERLPDGGHGLIVSHSTTIIAAMGILGQRRMPVECGMGYRMDTDGIRPFKPLLGGPFQSG